MKLFHKITAIERLPKIPHMSIATIQNKTVIVPTGMFNVKEEVCHVQPGMFIKKDNPAIKFNQHDMYFGIEGNNITMQTKYGIESHGIIIKKGKYSEKDFNIVYTTDLTPKYKAPTNTVWNKIKTFIRS